MAKTKLAQSQIGKLTLAGAPVKIEAAATEGEKKSPARFNSLAYTGGVVSRFTAQPPLEADYVIDLAGMSKDRSAKANLDHKATQRVGQITDYANDGKVLSLAGGLTAATTHRNEVVQSALDGYDWDVSIEADLFQPRRIAAGKTVEVNGQEFSGPLLVFAKSILTGVAFVSRGASEGNYVHIAATADKDNVMDEFEKWVVSMGLDVGDLDADQTKKMRAQFARLGKPERKPTGRKPFAELAAAERAENDRQDNIQKAALTAIREFPFYAEKIETAVESAIETNLSADDFELQLLRTTRNLAGSIHSRMGSPNHNPRTIEAAICMSAGLPNIEKHFTAVELQNVDDGGMRGFGIQQLLLQVAHQNGYSCKLGERIHPGNIRSVLEYAFPPAMAKLGGMSTINLPGILGNVANKEIVEGYKEEDPTWREIAEVKPVTNFFEHTYYRMLDNLEYEEVGSSGELTHGTLGQDSYTNQAKIYGRMLGLTMEQIVNDEVGAFDDIRKRLGMGGARAFNRLFWRKFMDNAAFFTAGRGNYIEGADSALGVDGVGLERGVLSYCEMKSPAADGEKEVGTMGPASILLVPPTLQFTGRKIYQSTNVNTGGAATSESVGNANVHAGLYRPVVQNRLSDAAYTGFSAKSWYLFGTMLKPMIVSFLNGQQTPTIQQADADFNTLGIQFRGFHCFGANLSEFLAGIKSKGEN